MSLLSVRELSKEEIMDLIQSGIAFKNGKKVKKDAMIANIFIEPSTRTLTSFQVAQDALGMKRYDLNIDNSSFKKGESLEDTLLNLEAMGINNFVVRSKGENYWSDFKKEHNIINGGDGTKHHPSQAILDAITIYEHFKTLENLKVIIVGDVAYSRVYHSLRVLLEKFDSEVVALDTTNPLSPHLSDVIANFDVVVMLRIQHERHADKVDVDGYNEKYGLNVNNVDLMRENSIFMHPGPLNRDVEIDSQLLYDHPKNKILEQVKNGVFARMAILEKTCKNT